MRIPDLIPAKYDCPSCGEPNEILVDPTGGGRQDFVEDCEACCRPSVIRVRIEDGVVTFLAVEPES